MVKGYNSIHFFREISNAVKKIYFSLDHHRDESAAHGLGGFSGRKITINSVDFLRIPGKWRPLETWPLESPMR